MTKSLFAALGTVVLMTGPAFGQGMMGAPRSISPSVNGIGSNVSVGRFANYPYGSYNYGPRYAGYPSPSYDYSPRMANYYTPDVQPMGAAAEIEVRVPADAELWLDGNPTKQRSETRTFASPPLQLGRTFTYEFRARWMQDGKPVEQTRQIQVSAGAHPLVDFRKP